MVAHLGQTRHHRARPDAQHGRDPQAGDAGDVLGEPGQDAAGATVAKWAHHIRYLDREMAEVDRDIKTRFRRHRKAAVIESMPGFGPLLGAELLAATGGDVSVFGTADRFAAVAGLGREDPLAQPSGTALVAARARPSPE